MAEEVGYSGQFSEESNMKIRDIEDKQRILKDRMLLIGQNLVEMKEKNDAKMLEMKKDIDNLQTEIKRISIFLEDISEELSKFARKEDMEILTKQAKMFQPLDFVRKEDLEKLKKNWNNK
jgi:phage host-nuclease inhibitor protein Gam